MKQIQTYRFLSIPPLWRWGQFAAGIITLSLGVALLVQAQIGLGPWDVLHQGIGMHTGMAIGTAGIVVGIVLMFFWLPVGERPGPGTLLNMIFVGLGINLLLEVLPPLNEQYFPTAIILPAQIIQMAGGVILTGIGSGLYIGSSLGAGPRDGLMMGLARRTGRSVRLIRTVMELSALLGGWLLGGTVGIGTLAFALGIGPVIQATLHITHRGQQENP